MSIRETLAKYITQHRQNNTIQMHENMLTVNMLIVDCKLYDGTLLKWLHTYLQCKKVTYVSQVGDLCATSDTIPSFLDLLALRA